MRGALAAITTSALAAGALAGCQLVFPLDPEVLPPDAKVTGTYLERRVTHTPVGSSVSEVAATGDVAIQARFVVDSEVRLFDVELAADGTFEIPRPAIDYTLVINFPTAPNPVPLELSEDHETLALAIDRGGAPQTPIPLTVNVPTTSPTQKRVVVSLGQYSNTLVGLKTTFNWGDAVPTGGFEVGLLGDSDLLFVLDYAQPFGYEGISAFGSAPGSMTAGVPRDLSGLALTEVVEEDGCIDLDLPLTSAIDRLETVAAAANPGFSAQATASWAIFSVPKIATGFIGAVTLVRGAHSTSTTEVKYADPFADLGHDALLFASAQIPRSASLPSAVTLTSEFAVVAPTSRDGCDPAAPLDPLTPPESAYAEDIRIDGNVLDTDDKRISISRTGPVTVTWTSQGAVDFFDVTLFEVNEVDSSLVRRRVFRSRTPSVEIDNVLLASGTAYVLVVTATNGFPGARDGDYTTAVYPVMVASIPSAVFRPN